MNLSRAANFFGHAAPRARIAASDKTPLIASLLLGFVGSLCCGGTLVFGAIGLGALYGALGIARYMPAALATGSILITLLNWLYYRNKAAKTLAANGEWHCGSLRRSALWGGFFGLVMMAGSFIFLEWLNHGVVHAAHFMHNPAFAAALIPGVPNSHLGYVAMTFLALPILAILPLPEKGSETRITQATRSAEENAAAIELGPGVHRPD